MGDKTGIEWTRGDDGSLGATWNPLRGCTRVSAGCEHCYAETLAARFSGPGQPYEGLATRVNGHARWTNQIRLVPEHFEDPLRWRRPRRVFVNSMSDLFHPAVPFAFVDQVFAVMALAPQHTFQVLTKRPERMREWATDHWFVSIPTVRCLEFEPQDSDSEIIDSNEQRYPWPLRNVWLGTSIENAAVMERLNALQTTPAAVRFLSLEPLIGRLPVLDLRGIAWVIVGGESGPDSRAMSLMWVREIVEQCRDAGVPVFVKQDSGRLPGKQGRIPDDLWLHEFPAQAVLV